MVDEEIKELMACFDPDCGIIKSQFRSIALLALSLNKIDILDEDKKSLSFFLMTTIANAGFSQTLQVVAQKIQPHFTKYPELEKALELLQDIAFYSRFYQPDASTLDQTDNVTLVRQFALTRDISKLAPQFAILDAQLLQSTEALLKLNEYIHHSVEHVNETDNKIHQLQKPIETQHFFKTLQSENIVNYFQALIKVLQALKPMPSPKNN